MDQVNLHFGTSSIREVDDALELYNAREFRSPTRSTLPLLSLLKHDTRLWRRIVGELTGGASEVDAHLEFQVQSPLGIGNASHTDVMLLTSDLSVAMEVKWSEPPYESVSKWLGSSENRRDVLNGWLSLIQPFTHKSMNCQDVESVVYQTVHRAASACLGVRTPKLVYLQFTPLPDGRSPGDSLFANLENLYATIGAPPGFSFYLVEVELQQTDAFKHLIHLRKGEAATARVVIGAFRDEPLFRFTTFRVRQVLGPIMASGG